MRAPNIVIKSRHVSSPGEVGLPLNIKVNKYD
jgi:hypothetical protein